MVLINLLTSIWKMEIDDMRKHVVVATRRLPPRNVGPPLPGMPWGMPWALGAQGAGMVAVCPTGYADDTHAITLAPAAAGGGLGGNGPHGGVDGRHRPVGQRSQVHLVAPAGAAQRGGAAHAGQGGHRALAGV